MDLKIYTRRKPQVYAKPSTVRLLHVSRSGEYLAFNVCAVNEIGISQGQRVLFAQDKSTNAWYFTVGEADDLTEGSKLRLQQSKGRITSLRCQNKEAANAILDRTGFESATYHIAKNPQRQDGREWYRILTTTPYRAKQ